MLVEEGKEEGGPGDVTKSLWRNILLIHVRLYNLAHFYSERGAARRPAERYKRVVAAHYSSFVPRPPPNSLLRLSPLKKRGKKPRKIVLFILYEISSGIKSADSRQVMCTFSQGNPITFVMFCNVPSIFLFFQSVTIFSRRFLSSVFARSALAR